MASRKKNAYLALYVGDDQRDVERLKLGIWDMMRHDYAFPVTVPDRHTGWLLLCQPSTDRHDAKWTLGRWASFGIVAEGGIADNAVVGYAPVSDGYGLPNEMEPLMRAISARRAGATATSPSTACGWLPPS